MKYRYMQGDSKLRPAFETVGTLECPRDVITGESQELSLRKRSSEPQGRGEGALRPAVFGRQVNIWFFWPTRVWGRARHRVADAQAGQAPEPLSLGTPGLTQKVGNAAIKSPGNSSFLWCHFLMALPACSQVPKGASPHTELVPQIFPTGVKNWKPLSATEKTLRRGGHLEPTAPKTSRQHYG